MKINRFLLTAGVLLTSTLAACGSNASAGNSGGNGLSGGRGFRGNGAVGQVVQISGGTLTVSSASGTDTTVTTTSSTTVSKTETSSLSSMTNSDCASVTGQKDSSGNVNAVNVTFFAMPSSGSCSRPAGVGGNFTPNPNQPRPSFSPPAGFTRTPRYSGSVSNVSDSSFTLTPTSSGALTINVATTTKVNQTVAEQVSDIQNGDCVAAIGTKQSNGDVAARTINITPMGPNGCSSGFAGGGRFGGGGGGFPGGGGGFPGGGGGGQFSGGGGRGSTGA